MPLSSPTTRTASLTAVLTLAAALPLPALLASIPGDRTPTTIPWWVLAACFAATEIFVFHLEIYHEAHSFSFSEVPLVAALFLAGPEALIVGRLVGELVALTVHERQPPLKLALNLATFFAECTVALAVFHALTGDASPLHPGTWLAVFVAVTAADILSVLAVSLAIVWHGGRPRWQHLAMAGGVTLTANTSLALVATILLWVTPMATGLLVLLTIVLFCAYRGYAALAQRYSSLQLLYDFTRMVTDPVRAEAVVEAMLGQARRLLRATTAEMMLVEGDVVRRWRMDEDDLLVVPARDDEVGAELLGVATHPDARLIPRDCSDPDDAALAERLGARDCMLAPLRSQRGVLGTIVVANRLGEVSTFDAADLRLFETLANHAAVALENGRLISQLRREAADREHEALHDPLTGLPNRGLFRQRLAETIRSTKRGEHAAVMLMDLDRFKEVNDTLGHHSGDLLLQQISVRLRSVGLPNATIARLGGDEFAILLPGVTQKVAVGAARQVRDSLEEPFLLDELVLDVRASIGIALWPMHGDDPSALLKAADVAMYAAKHSEAGVQTYRPDDDHHSPRRLALASDLRRSIDAGELLVYHQPKAELGDGRVVATEALVRWRHPVHGFVSPEEFIPLAETTGGIHPLATFVLRTALEHCADWRTRGHNFGVAVNLAVRNLRDAALPSEIARLLDETGVPPRELTLEITESSVMKDTKHGAHILGELAEIGVRLSIDDFGTGYSSLSYLQRLPVDEIKIDKSFVLALATDPGAATIVRSIIELSHNLGLRVVAEGVENGASWDRLRAMGCDFAQGYYLSPPVPEPDFMRWLADHEAPSVAPPSSSLSSSAAGG
jgi:diguanylate cyclase (GGDEF)-like protein